MTDTELLATNPPIVPNASLLWSAIVTVGETQDLGATPLGHRYLVPITGGHFFCGPNQAGLSGVVLQGGADRQLLRPDGVKELDALYEMQTECGQIITVRNRVILDDDAPQGRYAMSMISAKVGAGTFDWLNRRLLVGTLQSLRPKEAKVIVRAWLMQTN